jgi:hypothetical protein
MAQIDLISGKRRQQQQPGPPALDVLRPGLPERRCVGALSRACTEHAPPNGLRGPPFNPERRLWQRGLHPARRLGRRRRCAFVLPALLCCDLGISAHLVCFACPLVSRSLLVCFARPLVSRSSPVCFARPLVSRSSPVCFARPLVSRTRTPVSFALQTQWISSW